jgi:DNA primase small subunit
MDEATVALLKKAFREHYFNSAKRIEFPTKMEEREFGYIPFDGTMVRHLAFVTPGQLIAELVRQAPSSVYCSNARYSQPAVPMDEKGWIGAELIFDIDADMIPTSCKAKHNRWYCTNCRKEGRAPRPPVCPSCKRPDPVELHWTCRECLRATKEHVYRLTDFLERDFGVSDGEIRIHFSGSRGYHVQVYDERFYPLDTRARTEIASYILGNGIVLQRPRTSTAGSADEHGWAERIHRSTVATAESSSKNKTIKLSQKVLNDAVQVNAALIDRSVTTDVHRVFRMPGTLHGSSGLLKLRVTSLDNFDPQKDPVVLGDERIKVYIDFAPRFDLKGESFGPYNSTFTSLPLYAAVFLLAKELAKAQ